MWSDLSLKLKYSLGVLRSRYAASKVRLVSGPADFAAGATDLVVVSIIRDIGAEVEAFINHYQGIGCKHIVLLDNGSADDTVEKARQFHNVTILQTTLRFKTFARPLKRYLVERFGTDCWCLVVDSDEYFDYPMSDMIGLPAFLSYLNAAGYTAVAAHMLDMFSAKEISEWPDPRHQSLSDHCVWYDEEGIIKEDYHEHNLAKSNRFSSSAIKFYRGGIRNTAFGLKIPLTKHPLLFRPGGAKLNLVNAHFCLNAYVADISCVLYHYKFKREFRTECITAIKRGNFAFDSHAYKAYLKKVETTPQLNLKKATAVKLQNIDQLVASGFLVVSNAFCDHVRTQQPPSKRRLVSVAD